MACPPIVYLLLIIITEYYHFSVCIYAYNPEFIVVPIILSVSVLCTIFVNIAIYVSDIVCYHLYLLFRIFGFIKKSGDVDAGKYD